MEEPIYDDLLKSLEKLYRGYLASEIAEIDDKLERCQIYEDLLAIRDIIIQQKESNTP